MTHTENIEAADLAHLHRLFASATCDASAAMCRWTGGQITLQLDEVLEIPLEDVCAELNIHEEQLTMVVLGLYGEVGGEMVLAFDKENGRQLAASLLQRPVSRDEEWSEIEKSALCETGNILGCAYMNALTRLVGRELVPTPPYFIQDFAASVIQQALVSQAIDCEKVLVCRTVFHQQGEEMNWRVIFVPTKKMRDLMEKESHKPWNKRP